MRHQGETIFAQTISALSSALSRVELIVLRLRLQAPREISRLCYGAVTEAAARKHMRIPVALGHRFRRDLGTNSAGTWAPIPEHLGTHSGRTWAPIPEHLGKGGSRA